MPGRARLRRPLAIGSLHSACHPRPERAPASTPVGNINSGASICSAAQRSASRNSIS